jgi:hypothetical protein
MGKANSHYGSSRLTGDVYDFMLLSAHVPVALYVYLGPESVA